MLFSNNLAHNPVTLVLCTLERSHEATGAAESKRRPSEIGHNGLLSDESDDSQRSRDLARATTELLQQRAETLTPEEESVRLAARDMLRFGKFKPTGRSKPASEYLLGLARKREPLPQVMPAVDTANLISLKYLLPVSVWDIRRADAAEFVFRTGVEGESYVFNSAGHAIDVQDLVCGCRCVGPEQGCVQSYPIVNPVKDSMATKLTPGSDHIAIVVYAPSSLSANYLDEVASDVESLFGSYVGLSQSGRSIIPPGQSARHNAISPS